MAKRRRSRRRRPAVVWFAPRTESPNGGDWSQSCFADVAGPLWPTGSASSPIRLISPIVTNITQAISPTTDSDLNSHPISERWTIQRIVGQILVDVIAIPDQFGVVTSWDGVVIHAGIVRVNTIGDAFGIPRPDRNDSCLSDWMWMTHVQQSAAGVVCHNCPVNETMTGTGDASGSGYDVSGDIAHPVTGYEVFGRGNLIEIPVDIKVKRRVEPEHGVWLSMTAETAPGAVDRVELSVRPMLRALLARTV